MNKQSREYTIFKDQVRYEFESGLEQPPEVRYGSKYDNAVAEVLKHTDDFVHWMRFDFGFLNPEGVTYNDERKSPGWIAANRLRSNFNRLNSRFKANLNRTLSIAHRGSTVFLRWSEWQPEEGEGNGG